MKVCSQCIVPESFPGITFENGVCTFCRMHVTAPRVKKELLGKDKLLAKLTGGRKSAYHCVVGLSGGKDSSYALYYITRVLGFKPLAVFFDNGFITEHAKKNIDTICTKLNVDLVVCKATPFRTNIIKESVHLARFTGKLNACVNCENNLRTSVINEATKREIPYVIYAATDYEDPFTIFLNPAAKTFRETRVKGKPGFIGAIKKLKWNLFDPLFLPLNLPDRPKYIYHFLLSKYYVVRDNIRMRPPEGLNRLNPSMHVTFEGKKTETLYLFDYIEYNPQRMIETLKKEVGWGAPAGRESRMDCMLGCFANYQYLREKGITKDGFTFSVLVRNGLLSREEALRKEEILKEGLKEECVRVKAEILSRA